MFDYRGRVWDSGIRQLVNRESIDRSFKCIIDGAAANWIFRISS